MTDIETNAAELNAKPRPVKSKRGRRIFAFILIVLVLLLIGASFFLVKLALPQGKIAAQKDTNGLEWVRSIYGWGRAKNQQMIAPVSTAIAPDGTIWVVNPGNRQVVGFTPSGDLKRLIAGSNKTKFISPTDVAVDPQGNLYVGENTVDRVIVMTPGGQELRIIKVQTPTAVAASTDRIVVGSVGGFAIFDKEGNALKVIGQKGKADGQFDGVNGIVIGKDGHIYVTDSYNNRISAYDGVGKRLWIVKTGNPANQTDVQKSSMSPKKSGAEANLQLPLQATMDANGRLIVIDGFDMTLSVFNTANGKVLAKYGAFGSEDGKMLYPSGVSYDSTRDWFAVADNGNDRVQIVRLPGTSSAKAVGTVSRALSGPIRACLVPLLLLILAVIFFVVSRRRKRRAAAVQPAEVAESV